MTQGILVAIAVLTFAQVGVEYYSRAPGAPLQSRCISAVMPRTPVVTRKKLIARLDKVFSQWVRRKDADHRGYVECWTCGKVLPWSRVDAGHFQSRAKFSTRWDEMNVKAAMQRVQRLPLRGAVQICPQARRGIRGRDGRGIERTSNTTRESTASRNWRPSSMSTTDASANSRPCPTASSG